VTGKFSVDPNTGDVTVLSALDFETNPSITLVVTATDKGSPTARSSTSSVVITVSDVNDVAPVCAQSLYSATLAENAAAGAIGVTVSCPDVDTAVRVI
jgi:hypothetical protein